MEQLQPPRCPWLLTVVNMCVENVLAKSCGSAGISTKSGCSDSSPCVPVGHSKKMQQFQTKGFFRVFSFRNAWNTWFISEITCWWLSGLMYLIYKANLLDSDLTSSWYVRLGQYNQRQRNFWQCTVAASRRGFRISLRQVCSQLRHSCITVYMMVVL